MDCQDARTHLLDAQQGRLAPETDAEVRAHLEGCAACAHEAVAEQALTEILERRLPQHPASLALKRRLAAQWPAPAAARASWWHRRGRFLVPAAAVAASLLVAAPLYYGRDVAGRDRVMSEAVNDHLRVLRPDRPLAVESGGLHQVKPWFAGRLDFAPVVTFEGDQEFPLKGGTIEYFLDRRAAVFVYGHRLHTISLFVFRPEGLPLPARASERSMRGFNVVLWRAGDLGYALVSDVDPHDLKALATRLAAPA